jgi:arylsulfatase A-like enzyme
MTDAPRRGAALSLGAALALALGAALAQPWLARPPAAAHRTPPSPAERPRSAPSPDAPEAPPPLRAPPPDVILVVIDTLRVDAVGCYGSTLGLTPTIDALASRGTRFDRALATSSWTVPSVASIVTGLWPEEHGVVRGTVEQGEVLGQQGLSEDFTTLAEAFRARGYSTAGVVANAHLSAPLGFGQGFDLFGNTGFSTASSVLKWLQRHRDELRSRRPLFLWVHLFDPHHPYRPRSPWFEEALGPDDPDPAVARRLASELAALSQPELLARDDLGPGSPGARALRAAYLSEVGHADRALAETLELAGASDETLVVVTADHGEELREHGRLGHRSSLYSELVRVPLVVAWPARLPRGRVVEAPVSLVDLYPTLLELTGRASAPAAGQPLSGRSLVGRDGLAAEPGRPLHASVWFDGRFIRSVAVGAERLILDEGNGRVELYDEVAHPGDRDDLARTRPDVVARLRREIDRHVREALPRAKLPPPVTMSAEQVEQLRRLGYVE